MYTAYITCPYCKGSGLQMEMWGAETCAECKGDCVIRARDEKGKFIKVKIKKIIRRKR